MDSNRVCRYYPNLSAIIQEKEVAIPAELLDSPVSLPDRAKLTERARTVFQKLRITTYRDLLHYAARKVTGQIDSPEYDLRDVLLKIPNIGRGTADLIENHLIQRGIYDLFSLKYMRICPN